MSAFLSNQLVEPGYGDSRTWNIRNAPAEMTIEELLRPDTWAHAARKLKVYDEIIIIPQGGPYRAHLIVMDKGDNYAKLRLISVALLNAADVEDTPSTLDADAPVSVEWKGPALKYSVIRKGDNERLRTGFAIKAEAESWAAKHVAVMAT